MAQWKVVAHQGDTRWIDAEAWPAAIRQAMAEHGWLEVERDRARATLRSDGVTLVVDPAHPGRILELTCEDAAPPALVEDEVPALRFEPRLTGAAGVEEACHRTVLALEHAVPCQGASALLPRADRLEFVVARGPAASRVRSYLLQLDAGIAGYVFGTGRPVVVDDLEHDRMHLRGIAEAIGYRPRALLAVPIMDHALRVRGVIELLRDHEAFSPEDLRLARSAGLTLGEWLAMRG